MSPPAKATIEKNITTSGGHREEHYRLRPKRPLRRILLPLVGRQERTSPSPAVVGRRERTSPSPAVVGRQKNITVSGRSGPSKRILPSPARWPSRRTLLPPAK